MGGKQSKRSVDISGETGAGGAGEVAAAGAGGEGRVEPLADADALKPQLNGDAPHIQPPEEISEKEKQLENGTAENEKDATTEKETATNGAGADEQENGDAKPDADSNKKNKKEKVKKKWSLRSISFSRKEKPKQEKKQKDEEPKTNGETDKLTEEGVDASAVAESKSSEDVKVVVTTEENKDEKTPETPVTEPITNGSSAPETPKEETPAKEDSPVPSPTVEKPVEQVKAPEEPENLPINGLSLEDVKEEVPEVKNFEAAETKVEQPAAPEPEEPVSTPDIPVATEVCVGQSPLTEPAPPPLPHNPPPSSVTAFAETTMELHTVDASLPPVVAASPALAAISEIVPSVEGSPLDSKLDSQHPQNDNVPPTITSTPLNDSSVDVNIKKDIISEEIGAPITNVEPLENAEIIDRAKTPELNGTHSSEILLDENKLQTIEQSSVPTKHTIEVSDECDIPSDKIQLLPLSKEPESLVEPTVQVEDVEEVPKAKINAESVIENGDHKENGSDDDKEVPACLNGDLIQASESVIEITKTIIDRVEINSTDSSLLESALITQPIAKGENQINGSTLEAELAALQIAQNEQTIPPPTKPESLPVTKEVATSKSDEAESPVSPLSEAPPPPAHEDAIGSGEENRGSNEEVSGSFPLPPSELCPSESEASGPATPEPPQEEAPPVIENPVDIIIADTLANKTQLAEIVEARSSPVAEAVAVAAVTTAGAGDGAPSD